MLLEAGLGKIQNNPRARHNLSLQHQTSARPPVHLLHSRKDHVRNTRYKPLPDSSARTWRTPQISPDHPRCLLPQLDRFVRESVGHSTLRRGEHDGYHPAGMAIVRRLILQDLAEIGNAGGQVSEGVVADDGNEMLFVEPNGDLEGGAGDVFCGREGQFAMDVEIRWEGWVRAYPVRTFDAAENTPPNIVRQPERMFCTRDHLLQTLENLQSH